MAVNDDLFSKTEPKEKDKTEPRGVGLKQSEWEIIDKIADEFGDSVTSHAVTAFGLRYFLKQYQAGEVEIPVKQEPKIDMP
jgi:hypothetical protein